MKKKHKKEQVARLNAKICTMGKKVVSLASGADSAVTPVFKSSGLLALKNTSSSSCRAIKFLVSACIFVFQTTLLPCSI